MGGMKMKNGFTLVEIIIVISIMGLMATFGLPRLVAMQEGSRAGEGVQALIALRSSQLRYCLDHAANCSGTNYPNNGGVAPTCSAYDVDIPALKYFNTPVCQNTGTIYLDRSSGTVYRLIVNAAGTYDCVNPGTGNPPCPILTVDRVIPQ